MASMNRRILKILEESRQVDPSALADANRDASDRGLPIATVVVERRLASEDDLLGLLAARTGVPPINVHRVTVATDLLRQVPGELATQYGLLPISRIGSTLTVAVSNPFDVVKLDDFRLVTGCTLRLCLALPKSIDEAIERNYNPGESQMTELMEGIKGPEEISIASPGESDRDETIELNDAVDDPAASPVVKLVNLVIHQALRAKASDIHIEGLERRVRVRYRIDGVMSEALSPPRKMLNALVSRIKIMAAMDIAEKRKPQDGKFQVRAEGRQIDFRVSTLPTVHGEKVVMRVLDASGLSRTLDTLGFEVEALEDFRKAISSPYGMILVTGPTGSGKTTTLYSAVRELLSVEQNFVTVEDPVEYEIEGVNQVQVNVKRGLTFANALRSILRQDPDIILIGEIRDTETIDIAVKAALTGHLVLSTLHTNDAASTITRMVDMGVDPFMVSSSTLLVSAQRLMRKLCDHCKAVVEAPEDRLIQVGLTEEEIAQRPALYRAVGCARCAQGYSGRFAILETLPMSEEIRRLVVEGRSAMEIRNRAIETGMITLRRCAIRNALRGRSSIEEVLRVTADEHRRPKAIPEDATEIS